MTFGNVKFRFKANYANLIDEQSDVQELYMHPTFTRCSGHFQEIYVLRDQQFVYTRIKPLMPLCPYILNIYAKPNNIGTDQTALIRGCIACQLVYIDIFGSTSLHKANRFEVQGGYINSFCDPNYNFYDSLVPRI